MMNQVCTKVSGSTVTFLVLYGDIILIRNYIPMLQSEKMWLSKNFSSEDLGEAS